MPSSLVHKDLSEDVMRRLIETQREQWKRGHGCECLLLLDDMASERKFFESKTFKELCFNSRHLHITVIMTLQYACAIPPCCRANCDVVVSLAERMFANRRKLYESFFGLCSYAEFDAIFNKCTADYEALVLWNKATSNELSDSLMWYKADLEAAKSAKISNANFWKIHEHFSDLSGRTKAPGPEGSALIDDVIHADEQGLTVVNAREILMPPREDLRKKSPIPEGDESETDYIESEAFQFSMP